MTGDSQIARLRKLAVEQYSEWRVNPTVDRDDPTVKYVADLGQLLIGLLAIQEGYY